MSAYEQPACEQIAQLMRSLHTLHQSLEKLTLVPDYEPIDQTTLDQVAQQSADLLPQFVEIVEALNHTDITPAAEQTIRPCQTEAHRRLRLIKTESMRLRAARQRATLDKSRTQLTEHLSALQQFIEAIAQTVCG